MIESQLIKEYLSKLGAYELLRFRLKLCTGKPNEDIMMLYKQYILAIDKRMLTINTIATTIIYSLLSKLKLVCYCFKVLYPCFYLLE
jgi:hypothetical protein